MRRCASAQGCCSHHGQCTCAVQASNPPSASTQQLPLSTCRTRRAPNISTRNLHAATFTQKPMSQRAEQAARSLTTGRGQAAPSWVSTTSATGSGLQSAYGIESSSFSSSRTLPPSAPWDLYTPCVLRSLIMLPAAISCQNAGRRIIAVQCYSHCGSLHLHRGNLVTSLRPLPFGHCPLVTARWSLPVAACPAICTC